MSTLTAGPTLRQLCTAQRNDGQFVRIRVPAFISLVPDAYGKGRQDETHTCPVCGDTKGVVRPEP